MENIFAKGGKTKVKYDYIPQKAIDELSYTIDKVTKGISGDKLLSGVYVKSDAKSKTKSGSNLTAKILAMTDDEDKKEVILEKDVKEFQKYISDKLITAFYLGLPLAYDFKGDYSYGGGVITMVVDDAKRKTTQAIKNAKNKKFELGLKYPQYDFEKLLGKPIIKDVFGKTMTFNDGTTEKYQYRLWIWKDCVIGQTIGSENSSRGFKDFTYGEKPTLMGGYKSVQTSKESKLESIINFMAKDKDGFVKDNNVLYNGLGGADFETLETNKIKYAKGGKTQESKLLSKIRVGNIIPTNKGNYEIIQLQEETGKLDNYDGGFSYFKVKDENDKVNYIKISREKNPKMFINDKPLYSSSWKNAKQIFAKGGEMDSEDIVSVYQFGKEKDADDFFLMADKFTDYDVLRLSPFAIQYVGGKEGFEFLYDRAETYESNSLDLYAKGGRLDVKRIKSKKFKTKKEAEKRMNYLKTNPFYDKNGKKIILRGIRIEKEQDGYIVNASFLKRDYRFAKGGKTKRSKHSLMQDRRRVSSEPWEVAYQKRKSKMEAGGTLPTPFGQAGLVGETGAMNEMELFAMGGGLPQGVHQYYANTYNPAYPTPHGYAKGGILDKYMVWVGGVVEAENISKDDAEIIAMELEEDGYDDVAIEKMAKGGEVEGGAFDLSLREKSAMYKYLDKGDFTEEKFMKMFDKNEPQTADIIYYWAESRGLNTPQSRRLHKSSMKQMGYAKGGDLDSRYSYDIEYVDSEGDEYNEGFDSLEDAKKEIKYLKENGYRITRKFRYLDDKYVGSFAKGGKLDLDVYYSKMVDKLGKEATFIRILKDSQFDKARIENQYRYSRNGKYMTASVSDEQVIFYGMVNETFTSPKKLAEYLDKNQIYAKGGMTDVERQSMIDMGYTQEQIKEVEDNPRRGGRFAKGGKIGFDGLAKKVAKKYEGKPVKEKFQSEYGKTYSKAEAMEVGKKVAGKVYRQQQSMAKGGEIQMSEIYNVNGKDYLFHTPLQNDKGTYTGWDAYEVVYDIKDGEKHLNYTKTKKGKSKYFPNGVKRTEAEDSFAKGGEIESYDEFIAREDEYLDNAFNRGSDEYKIHNKVQQLMKKDNKWHPDYRGYVDETYYEYYKKAKGFAKGGVLSFKSTKEADKYLQSLSDKEFKKLGDFALVYNGKEYIVKKNFKPVGYAKGGKVKTYNNYYKTDKTIDGVPYTKQGEYAFKEIANISKASDWSRSKTKIVKEGDKYVLYVHHKGFAKGGKTTQAKYYTYDIVGDKVHIYQQNKEDENSFDSIEQIITQLKKEGHKEKDFVVPKKDGRFAKGGKTQGYNDKLDESLGNTKGKRSTKEQNYKDRRNESEAMKKKGGKRKYSSVKTMDKGSRSKRKTPLTLAKEIRKEGEKWQDAVKRASAILKKEAK